MIYKRLIISAVLTVFVMGISEAQNFGTPYPGSNALEYLRYWGDSTRMGYRGSLSAWGSRLTLSASSGVQFAIYPDAASSVTPVTRLQLGWWITPVSAIEVGGAFGTEATLQTDQYALFRSAEMNYRFSFSKFVTRNAGFERMSLEGLVGVQAVFAESNQRTNTTFGAHIALRGVYHLRRGVNFFLETRMGYHGLNEAPTQESMRAYALTPSVSLGMQLRLRTINRYSQPWATERDQKLERRNVAIKTNLLYGALAYAPNVGVELLLSSRFTLEGTIGFNPFDADKRGRYAKHTIGQLAGRYWFDHSFNGAFVALHATVAGYNLSGHSLPGLFGEARTDIRYDGLTYGGGVSLGYLWRLGEHWGVEAELGAGYLSLNYDRYDLTTSTLAKDLTRDYFGLTKASLSMVYLFDAGKIDIKRLNFFPALFAKRDDLQSFVMALKTNVLYGAVAYAPNIGFELGLSPHITLEVNAGYNPWRLNADKGSKLVHSMYQLGGRYWTRGRFDGFFAGIHGLYTNYNISHRYMPMLFGQQSSYYRFQGNGYGAGVSVGYLWRVGRRWGIEAELGGGYVRMRYDKYDCVNCGRKIEPGIKRDFLGPTKAGLSLVYMIK